MSFRPNVVMSCRLIHLALHNDAELGYFGIRLDFAYCPHKLSKNISKNPTKDKCLSSDLAIKSLEISENTDILKKN